LLFHENIFTASKIASFAINILYNISELHRKICICGWTLSLCNQLCRL